MFTKRYVLSNMTGIPRALFPIHVQAKLTAFGRLVVSQGNRSICRFNGQSILYNYFSKAVHQHAEHDLICSTTDFKRVAIFEKPEMAENIWHGLSPGEKAVTIVLAYHSSVSTELRAILKFLERKATSPLAYFVAGDSDLNGYRTALSFEFEGVTGNLSRSETCLLQEVKLVTPPPQCDNQMIDESFVMTSIVNPQATPMSDGNLQTLEELLQRHTSEQNEQANRMNHLVGFRQNKRTARYEDYPQTMITRYIIDRVNDISPV